VLSLRVGFAAKHMMGEMNIDERLESLAKSIEASNLRSAEIDTRLEAGFEKTQRQIDALLAVQADHDRRLAEVTSDLKEVSSNVNKMAQIWQETAQDVARLAYNI
jgi:septation ring formation regulator EzrA